MKSFYKVLLLILVIVLLVYLGIYFKFITINNTKPIETTKVNPNDVDLDILKSLNNFTIMSQNNEI
jgi:hypothetical protein